MTAITANPLSHAARVALYTLLETGTRAEQRAAATAIIRANQAVQRAAADPFQTEFVDDAGAPLFYPDVFLTLPDVDGARTAHGLTAEEVHQQWARQAGAEQDGYRWMIY